MSAIDNILFGLDTGRNPSKDQIHEAILELQQIQEKMRFDSEDGWVLRDEPINN